MTPDYGPYRVMIVDDSAVIRGLLTRLLEEDGSISVVASVPNGQLALSALPRHSLEVVVLDIEMPVMDGLTALPKLLEAQPDLQVIMASTLTRKNAEISMRALRGGAADYVTKPSSSGELQGADDFKRELVAKVKALGQAARGGMKPAPRPARSETKVVRKPAVAAPLNLRKASLVPPQVLAIGSSTGGPQALFKVLGDLKGTLKMPVLITQHMPATFTTLLAEHLGRVSGMPCHEAVDGEQLLDGTIYVAPGDYHMIVDEKDGRKVIRLNQNPPENFCRPAVDPMLRSLAQLYGQRLLVVILTGMGSDGMKGAQSVVSAGGTVIAQDEESSVVWGMPGAVATNGLCSAVLPVSGIASHIRKLVMRSAA